MAAEVVSVERDGVEAAREALERCVGAGGVALFPSDGLYGLACDPLDASAWAQLGPVGPHRRPQPSPHAVADDGRADALADRVGDTRWTGWITRKEGHRNRSPATPPARGQRVERRPVADPPDQALSL